MMAEDVIADGAMHVVDDTVHSMSLLTVFDQDHDHDEDDDDDEELNRLSDGEDRFSRLFQGNFPESAPALKRYKRQSLRIPKTVPPSAAIAASTLKHANRSKIKNLRSASERLQLQQQQPPTTAYPQEQDTSSIYPADTAQSFCGIPASAFTNRDTQYDIPRLVRELEQEREAKEQLYSRLLNLESKIEMLEGQRHLPKNEGSGSPITPRDLPRGQKEYYRLQLDQVDEMSPIELGNVVKNMLLLLNTPLTRVQQFIPALAKVLHQEDHYMDFARRLHESLFGEPLSNDEDGVRESLERMFYHVQRAQLGHY